MAEMATLTERLQITGPIVAGVMIKMRRRQHDLHLLERWLILLVLGMFFDPTGIVLLTAPIFFPIATSLGFDPLWFAILFVINMELAFLTPPFGFNMFYMKAVAPPDVNMMDIYRSATPFVLLMILGLALCMIFPGIITWLPSLMRT